MKVLLSSIEFRKEFKTFLVYERRNKKTLTSILLSFVVMISFIVYMIKSGQSNIGEEFRVIYIMLFSMQFGYSIISNFNEYFSPYVDRDYLSILYLNNLKYIRLLKYRILIVSSVVIILKLIFLVILNITIFKFRLLSFIPVLLFASVTTLLQIFGACNTNIEQYKQEVEFDVLETRISLILLLKNLVNCLFAFILIFVLMNATNLSNGMIFYVLALLFIIVCLLQVSKGRINHDISIV